MSGELWPFRPLVGTSSEMLEWLTDPLGSRTGEQRIALRDAPRQGFAYAFALDPEQYSRAKTFARRNGAEDVLVPVWMEQTRNVGALSAADDVIAFDTAYADYRPGSAIAIWESDRKAVTATIDEIDGDGVTLTAPIGVDFTNPTVAPARQALLPDGIQVNRERGLTADLTARFQVLDNVDLSGAEIYDQFLALDVLTDPPARVAALAENIVRAREYRDNGFGPIVVETQKAYADFGQTLGFSEEGKAALWRRRQWLHNRWGQQKAFWLPSFANDLVLQAGVGSAAVTLSVASIAPASFYFGKSVMIELKSGARFFRTINSAINAGANDTLTIASALGTAVTPADVRLFCLLSKVRLATDAVTIVYRATSSAYRPNDTDLSTCTVPVTEVPA